MNLEELERIYNATSPFMLGNEVSRFSIDYIYEKQINDLLMWTVNHNPHRENIERIGPIVNPPCNPPNVTENCSMWAKVLNATTNIFTTPVATAELNGSLFALFLF